MIDAAIAARRSERDPRLCDHDGELLIALDRVRHIYQTAGEQVLALNDVSLSIRSGEFVSIMGRSGSGKSTLLNILGCLDWPRQGGYRFRGQEIRSYVDDDLAQLRNSSIGFIFQNFKLLPRLTALDNVALPLLYAGLRRRERRRIAAEKLAETGLAGFESRLPTQLSGGQQQRVAIARALINAPQLLLADEPTGALDSETSAAIMDLLGDLNRRIGLTLVLVTHEPEVAALAERRFLMVDGALQEQRELTG